MGNKKISVTLIANAGVLIEYNEVKILIDGIHYDKEHNFSRMPDQLLIDALDGNGMLKDIDFIMFSHEHSDHFAPEFTLKYLENNCVKCIFIPRDGSDSLKKLQQYIQDRSINCRLLKLPIAKSCCYQLNEDISVNVFNTIHMGKQYATIDNYCFLLTFDEKSILFTADADYVDTYFENPLLGKTIDTVFVNPLFFNNIAGRRVIEKFIKPSKVGIYHIPFPKDDKFMFRRIVNRDMERFKNDLYDTFSLCEEGQKIII